MRYMPQLHVDVIYIIHLGTYRLGIDQCSATCYQKRRQAPAHKVLEVVKGA